MLPGCNDWPMSRLTWTLSHHQARVPVADFVAEYVDPPRFAALCEGCPSLGKTWACPPHESDPFAVWNGYDWLHLLATQLHFSEPDQQRSWPQDELISELGGAREAEKQRATAALLARVEGMPDSRVLYGGGACPVCETCARLSGEECPHPDLIQYSIESLGGDVGRTASELLGIELAWAGPGRLPPATTVVLGVLSDSDVLPG